MLKNNCVVCGQDAGTFAQGNCGRPECQDPQQEKLFHKIEKRIVEKKTFDGLEEVGISENQIGTLIQELGQARRLLVQGTDNILEVYGVFELLKKNSVMVFVDTLPLAESGDEVFLSEVQLWGLVFQKGECLDPEWDAAPDLPIVPLLEGPGPIYRPLFTIL